MKLLFDQNISYRILPIVEQTFPGSSHVKEHDLANATDIQIWQFAKEHNFTIVTLNSDYNDLGTFQGSPPKIIWLRARNLGTIALGHLILKHKSMIRQFLLTGHEACLEVRPPTAR